MRENEPLSKSKANHVKEMTALLANFKTVETEIYSSTSIYLSSEKSFWKPFFGW